MRIHDILGWIRIRIRGSMPLTNGSGSGFGSGFGSGSWIRILLFSSLTFNLPAKNKFFNTIFSVYYFLKLHLHHFTKIKCQKESLNSKNQSFSNYFCMMIEGSGSRAGSGSGSIPLTSGSGSGSRRPKNTWIRWFRIRIRIRIRNTAAKVIKTDFNFKKIAIKIWQCREITGFIQQVTLWLAEVGGGGKGGGDNTSCQTWQSSHSKGESLHKCTVLHPTVPRYCK